ncbi:MAG: hypothetical protein LUD68_03910 [Rikenellaceae bacterium]|nr:hypothetical protein [Rikenellaceae bacterium]
MHPFLNRIIDKKVRAGMNHPGVVSAKEQNPGQKAVKERISISAIVFWGRKNKPEVK